MNNKFGEKIYLIPKLAADPVIMSFISKSLKNLFEYVGFEGSQLDTILDKTLSSFDDKVLKENSRLRGQDIEYDLPMSLLEFYDKTGYREKDRKRSHGRVKAIFSLINPYLIKGETILDVGTGNGYIALNVHNAGHNINIMDVTDNRSPQVKEKESEGLEFVLHGVDEPLRYPLNSYDTSLAMVILHHSDDPVKLLNELIRVTKKRLIIYESTFGVSKEDTPSEVIITNRQLYESYFKLNREQQKMYGTFLDWFLNKLLFRNDAHIPYNYTSPDKWEKLFRNRTLTVKDKKILGFDNPGISEFHILYVLEK